MGSERASRDVRVTILLCVHLRFFSLVGNNAAKETVAFLGDALTLVHLYFGSAVDESLWSFDLVVIGCCS